MQSKYIYTCVCMYEFVGVLSVIDAVILPLKLLFEARSNPVKLRQENIILE